MISERQLVIPLYISVLHVEQEAGVVVEQDHLLWCGSVGHQGVKNLDCW